MENIRFNYLYRDGANYKNLNSIIFENINRTDIVELHQLIKNKLIAGKWFYANQWKLPDMHFGSWDQEFDHAFHEFESIEYTDEEADSPIKLDELIILIKKTNWG